MDGRRFRRILSRCPMTMLYRLDADAAAIGRRFGLEPGDDPWAGGHIAPDTFALVITAGREEIAGPRPEKLPLRMVPRLWGVPPPPSVTDASRAVYTVRNPDSPFWIGNLRNTEFRCLVPATAFMEWGRPDPANGKRRKHWFACPDQPIFALAGVWKDSEIPGFALLTCRANAALREYGCERMPVILPGDAAALRDWLYGGWDRAGVLLAGFADELVARRV
ncbi:MAG: SOS response-associated peptidase family protein [Novosphingobium sp.]|nr:SOS response-associated peptidase family protein [Novosphingobium sp.]